MAILYRTNSQSRALEEAFRRAGVPYRLVGATSFYDRREVKDLLAYLRLVSNPSDDEAFLRAVGVPRRGWGNQSGDSGPDRDPVGQIAARNRAHRRSGARPPAQRAGGLPQLRRPG